MLLLYTSIVVSIFICLNKQNLQQQILFCNVYQPIDIVYDNPLSFVQIRLWIRPQKAL